MFYIVGLGNPGKKYANTRHNVGWLVLDYCLKEWQLPNLVNSSNYSGRITKGSVNGGEITVLYPDTFMNNSGSAVKKMVSQMDIKQLIVVHDDIDLPFGDIRVGVGQGAAGNKGVKSIIDDLGSKDFIRIRIGIAPKSFWTGMIKRPQGGGPLERFVLKSFTKNEEKQLPDIYQKAKLAVEMILKDSIESAMNLVN